MTQPIRVLHVVQSLNYGGMERLIAGIVRGVDGDRFESHVLALQYLGRFAEGLDSARLHVAGPMPRSSLLWPRELTGLIRRIAPDVVHTHSGVWHKASLAARHAGVRRLVHTEHGRRFPDPWQERLFDRLGARRTDVVVAVSATVAGQLHPIVVSDRRRIRVVLNGVDCDALRPIPDTGSLRRELGLAPDIPILGSIGRLETIKGYDLMIEAFARLPAPAAGSPPPVLVLAGDGSQREALRNRVDQLGLRPRVHFLGWRDDVRDLLSAFSLFTMSSRSEGTSVSLLEAMSMGVCPVVTDVGGNGAVLGTHLRHRLVAPFDPGALAEAWGAALRDPVGLERDSALARLRVTGSFSEIAMVRAYEKLYLGEPAAAPPP